MAKVASKLRISEIFHSIQGEGIWLGTPSVFVRVSGCNLRCVWCDTPYASWKPEGPTLSVEEILERVSAYSSEHVVLTGGEPMFFPAVVSLALRLKDLGHVITVETAGTVFQELPCDLMSISPKLSNSVPLGDEVWSVRHEQARLNVLVLSKLLGSYNCQLKFVVSGCVEADVGEIEELLALLPAVAPGRVLLMPEGTDAAVLSANMRALVEPAMKRGWRVTPRLHIDLFGNTRGT